MSSADRITKYHEFAKPYETEFAEHGLENLVLRPDAAKER